MAKTFLKTLKEAGHTEVRGVFVYGGKFISDGIVDAVAAAKIQAGKDAGHLSALYGVIPLLCDYEPHKSLGEHRHYQGHQPEPL